jgi:hypothetical protein
LKGARLKGARLTAHKPRAMRRAAILTAALSIGPGTFGCGQRSAPATGTASPDTSAPASPEPGPAPPVEAGRRSFLADRCRAACTHVGALVRADVGSLEGASETFLAELDALAGAPCVDRCVEAGDLAAVTCVLAATDLLTLGGCQPRPSP